MKHPIALVMCSATFITSAFSAPIDRPWTHYNDLLALIKLDKFYSAPLAQRDKVIMRGVVHPNNPAFAEKDVVFTIVNGSEHERIQVSQGGDFDVPFKAEWVKSNPEVLTTVPEGQKAKFSFRASPVMPQGTHTDYANLMGGVPQVNALIKSQAGMLRFMMPTITGVTVKFPKGSHSTILLATAGGVIRMTADASGLVKLQLNQALLAANVPVTLSKTPIDTDFIED